MKYLNNIENRKNTILKRIDIEEERIKRQKIKQEKEKLEKYNKLYMQREDHLKLIERNERIKQYLRELKLEQINLRMKQIKQMQEVRKRLEEKRKQREKKLKEDKIYMRDRLNKIMNKDDEVNLSRDEILEYVLNNIKPNINNKGNKTPITRRNNENKNNLSNNSKDIDNNKSISKSINNKSVENKELNDI